MSIPTLSQPREEVKLRGPNTQYPENPIHLNKEYTSNYRGRNIVI